MPPYIDSLVNFVSQHSGTFVDIASIVVTVAITVYISKRYMRSARDEKVSKARESVLNKMEEHLKNDRDITPEKLDRWISTAGDDSIELSNQVSKITLLRNLEWRIENSPHLTFDKKEEYTDNIEGFISRIEDSNTYTTEEVSHLLDDIYDELENGEVENALSIIDNLEKELEKSRKKIRTNGKEPVEPLSYLFPVMVLIAGITLVFETGDAFLPIMIFVATAVVIAGIIAEMRSQIQDGIYPMITHLEDDSE